MTKINGIYEQNRLQQSQKATSTVKDDLFKNTLDKALKVKDGPETTAADHSGTLGEIQAAPLNIIEDITNDVQDETNQLIDLLESYAGDLGDPDKTLKDIEPKLEALKESAEKLMEKVGRVSQDNPVRKIATESAMAANIEYIKFNRGDYV